MPGWAWAIYALAVARLTGLIVADEITRPARERLLAKLDETRPTHRAVGYLTTCAWCVSGWLAIGVAPVAWFWGHKPAVFIPASALAMSFVAGATSDMGRAG